MLVQGNHYHPTTPEVRKYGRKDSSCVGVDNGEISNAAKLRRSNLSQVKPIRVTD